MSLSVNSDRLTTRFPWFFHQSCEVFTKYISRNIFFWFLKTERNIKDFKRRNKIHDFKFVTGLGSMDWLCLPTNAGWNPLAVLLPTCFVFKNIETGCITFIWRRSYCPNYDNTLGKSNHGRLYRWTENFFPFFLYLKPVEISKKCFNTIWTSLKVV